MGSVARPPSAAAICYDGEMTPRELLSGLYQFDDECNVYVVVRGGGAVAIDFGSGRWLDQYATSGLPTIEHVFLTHHHSDQCAGLEGRSDWPFVIHAPIGDLPSISPQGVADYWQHRSDAGVPRSYDVLRRGIEHVSFDMAGFSDMFWRGGRVRFIHTPGHTRTAISVLMDIGRKQVLFCGDAAHAGATIHKPYMLEWDHWTGEGALAGFEGVERMRGLGIDLLCPAHGPVVTDSIRPMLGSLSKRLLDLYRVKGSICAGERDRYVTPTWTDDGALRITPGLYSTGGNTYVLQSASGEVMVVDPWRGENDALRALLEKLGNPRITAATEGTDPRRPGLAWRGQLVVERIHVRHCAARWTDLVALRLLCHDRWREGRLHRRQLSAAVTVERHGGLLFVQRLAIRDGLCPQRPARDGMEAEHHRGRAWHVRPLPRQLLSQGDPLGGPRRGRSQGAVPVRSA